MKKFKYGNVILRTNDPKKEKELLLRGFKEVKETKAKNEAKEKKAKNDNGKQDGEKAPSK